VSHCPHVLERMHRGVQFARINGLSDFGDECAALRRAAQLAGLVESPDVSNLTISTSISGARRGQTAGNSSVCASAHHALARADPYSNCHYSRSIRYPLTLGAHPPGSYQNFLGDHNGRRIGIADIRSGMIDASTTREALDPAKAKPLIDHRERIVPIRQVDVG